MREPPKLVGIEYLVPILGKSLKTLKNDVTAKPETLPPRANIPGLRKPMFFESVVIDWLESFMPAKPEPAKKRGRPSSVVA